MVDNGYIRLHRKILGWEWFKNPNTFHMFVYLLLKANYQQAKYEGKTLQRGQLLTTLPQLATDNQQTIQQARTSLSHLISTGEITVESNNRYRIITVVKYDDYQVDNRQINRQTTGKQQAEQQAEQQLYKNNIKKQEERNNKRFTPPTIEEVRSFVKEENIPVNPDYFFDHYESSGWVLKGGQKMKNWKATLRNWGRRETDGKYGVRKVPDGENRSDYSFLHGTTVRV